MKDQILQKLQEIELQHNVEILFAVESGSRAWGFASPDSDYDIRFVYKRKMESYLSLWDSKDSIEFMTEDDLDGSGWDLKKATLLLAKSNASFLGWLFSPIVYINRGGTLEAMKQLAIENFNPIAGFYHYHSMNKGFYEQLESKELKLKAFFYATRTAFCANWILKHETIPPVLFQDLYSLIDEENAEFLDKLIARKAHTNESGFSAIDDKLIALVKEIVLENNNLKDSIKAKKANVADFERFFINQLS
ncbi:nucleotidyltransferase domain-containing protein [Fluviicola taffensis]|uniref:Nucleotidyltransferase n=1 Tax=Fluviicola taffensis (strain DSM 16823 / NCIMB 13979 / RW262) TaxID=755732 RepID=F2IGF6_FLUTR|nr:nucleotidyltransferase domain-containing protein [Fluviicola taffensis]AEA42562.1 Nucleotidyltransferase [Fluviicola taffensis DSM 16823]